MIEKKCALKIPHKDITIKTLKASIYPSYCMNPPFFWMNRTFIFF
jgi:hypothetical protein